MCSLGSGSCGAGGVVDPVSVGLLVALAGGAGGELGHQVWAALGALVRRPLRHLGGGGDAPEVPEMGSGAAEVAALEQAPADEQRGAALSAVLARRAAEDADFAAALDGWRQQADRVPFVSEVHNRISGGTFHQPVLQGRDFSGLTFGAPLAPATPPPPAPDVGNVPGRPGPGQETGTDGSPPSRART